MPADRSGRYTRLRCLARTAACSAIILVARETVKSSAASLGNPLVGERLYLIIGGPFNLACPEKGDVVVE
jgi:hypothetical protein